LVKAAGCMLPAILVVSVITAFFIDAEKELETAKPAASKVEAILTACFLVIFPSSLVRNADSFFLMPGSIFLYLSFFSIIIHPYIKLLKIRKRYKLHYLFRLHK